MTGGLLPQQLADAIDSARRNDDRVHLDVEVAEALYDQLTTRPSLAGPEARAIEEALDLAWDELSGAKFNALTQLTTGLAVVEVKLAAIRSVLDRVGAGDFPPEPPEGGEGR